MTTETTATYPVEIVTPYRRGYVLIPFAAYHQDETMTASDRGWRNDCVAVEPERVESLLADLPSADQLSDSFRAEIQALYVARLADARTPWTSQG